MYASIDNLKALCGDEELIQLTDRADPPSGEIDEATVTTALAAASSVIDGFLAARYQLPLASTPQLLTDLACEIARYRLYKTAATEQVTARHKEAMLTLEKISGGKIGLPVGGLPGEPAEANAPAALTDIMVVVSEPRRFSRASTEGL